MAARDRQPHLVRRRYHTRVSGSPRPRSAVDPRGSLEMIGHSKWDLDTPALLLDLAAMDRNIERMAATFRQAGVGWRPHTKAIKIPAIAHKLLRAGALGITCAKVSEADVMVAGGIRDILIAN